MMMLSKVLFLDLGASSTSQNSMSKEIKKPTPPLIRAVRRRHCVGGGAPVNFGRRRRAAGPQKSAAAAAWRGVGGQKHFFLRFTNKFRSILKNFLRNFFSHQSF